MKIRNNLPQFENERALIAVVGKQEAIFYFANKGVVEELRSFRFEKPKHSDREGFFMSRGASGVYRSGAVYESKKEKIIAELIFHLKNNLGDILNKNRADVIYLSSPDYLKNDVLKSFPSSYKKKIKLFLKGDYCHFHPFEVLEKIGGPEKETVVLKEDAAKILNKTTVRRRPK